MVDNNRPDEAFDDMPEPSFKPEDETAPPRPINWNLLTSHDLEQELLALNRWVNWLRWEYGLPASEVPPLWHRHPELLWELSALHLHWLSAYDAEQDGSAPFGWHRDFADARGRLRDWVAASGTRRDRDRPTRRTPWPGEEHSQQVVEQVIHDREADFVEFVLEQVQAREGAEDAFYANIDFETGEVRE